ncbi:hypothetical protein [Streptomyces yerevanensis]|uniref:hypothetical protein n=1 Tax=Streptomyces yerevanensis TaxID=66378 RepID=UPI0012FF0146|nr:hypothetical protein [Streptomyces yerevanensis]
MAAGSVVRSVSGLRVLAPPRLAEHSGAMAVRTRLHLSRRDERVLAELGEFLGELANRDLAERIFLGAGHTTEDFARRKRELTALSSSRWAGTITRGSNDQWALARRAQAAHLAELEQAIATVSARLAVPVGACHGTTRIEGYPSQAVRAAKQRRLIHLQAEATRVRAAWEQGHVRVVRGGRGLLHTRLHLEQAGLDQERWRRRWREARTRIEADGESGKRHGNQSIHITPDGTVTIKLPPELAARHARWCDAHGRYPLDARCAFAYRDRQWRAQVGAHRAVGYRIAFEDGRCYQGLGARRRAEKTVPRKQTEAVPAHPVREGRRCATTHPGTGTEDHRPPALTTQPDPDRTPTARARLEDRAHDARRRRPHATAESAQHRSERATDVQTWTQNSLPLSV